jgi:hypothetical protein
MLTDDGGSIDEWCSLRISLAGEYRKWPAEGQTPRWTRNGHQAPQQSSAHSITSSASATSVGGKVSPRALAVLKLTTSSNLVGCSTGSSAAKTLRPVLAGVQSAYQVAIPKEKRKKRGTASHQHGAPHAPDHVAELHEILAHLEAELDLRWRKQ